MEYTAHYDSPLGGITLSSDGEALLGLWFDGQKHFAAALAPDHAERALPVFDLTRRWLDVYFGGRDPGFKPPLRMRSTPFRRAVWEILLGIPFGRTMTYGEIAARAGIPKGARAVGQANHCNPIPVLIPCHRVVAAGGMLGGYGGGAALRIRLLELEGVRGLRTGKTKTRKK